MARKYFSYWLMAEELGKVTEGQSLSRLRVLQVEGLLDVYLYRRDCLSWDLNFRHLGG